MADRPGTMYAIAGVMIVLAIIPVPFRFYARRFKKQPVLLDDWLILPALVSHPIDFTSY